MAQAQAKAEVVRPEVVMSEAEAKSVTADIRRRLGDVQQRSERLLEAVRRAHREAAWKALGYKSWKAYVDAEFPGLSRGQNYRLVAWGRVVGELEEAAGAPVEVSGRQATALQGRADAVAAKVRERLADKRAPTAEDRRAAVTAALDEEEAAKARARAKTPPPPDDATTAVPPAASAPVVAPPQPPAPDTSATPAADLLAALLAIEPDLAAASVEVEDLDATMAWIGRVRAAKRRLGVPTTRTEPAAASSAPAAKAAKKAAAKASDCKHPANRRVGPACMACGQTVG